MEKCSQYIGGTEIDKTACSIFFHIGKNYIYIINACMHGGELKFTEYILVSPPPKKTHKLYFCKLSLAYYPTFLLITENLILQFKVTQTLPDLRWSVQDPSHFFLLPCFSSSSMDRCIVLESRGVASGPMLPSVLPLASAVHLFWSPS